MPVLLCTAKIFRAHLIASPSYLFWRLSMSGINYSQNSKVCLNFLHPGLCYLSSFYGHSIIQYRSQILVQYGALSLRFLWEIMAAILVWLIICFPFFSLSNCYQDGSVIRMIILEWIVKWYLKQKILAVNPFCNLNPFLCGEDPGLFYRGFINFWEDSIWSKVPYLP